MVHPKFSILARTNITKVRILLLGEFSRLHNTLKEGLETLGHEVVLVNNGDGFKNYPADYSIRAHFFTSRLGSLIRKAWHRLFRYDLALLEHGVRCWGLIHKLQGFDIVQCINEKPIQTLPRLEYYLLQKIIRQNKHCFLLSCGVDAINLPHLLAQKERYSILTPYFENPTATAQEYAFMWEYQTPSHQKIHRLLMTHCQGIIASDLDYVAPLSNHPKYLGLIPNPINTQRNSYTPPALGEKVVIFLGINSGTYLVKGIHFFEKALQEIQSRWGDRTEIIITRDVPYATYHTHFQRAHLLLDQVYAFDQGYNALEAMAQGKVVFTGAEQEFLTHYGIQANTVAINALPDVDYLVKQIESFIQSPEKIKEVGERAQAFIRQHHDHISIAKTYCQRWESAI